MDGANTLRKSYKKVDTTSTMEGDAKAAFGVILPHLYDKYDSIRFDPIEHLCRNERGGYCVCGSYERTCLGKSWLKITNVVNVHWQARGSSADEFHQDYGPVIEFGCRIGAPLSCEFDTLDGLDKLVGENTDLKPKQGSEILCTVTSSDP